MSDLQTNIEIEDVLASIRRLVSDGETASAPLASDSLKTRIPDASRPANDVSISAPSETANNPSPPEKFVLSPELLVRPAEETVPTAPEVKVSTTTEPPYVLAETPFVLTQTEPVSTNLTEASSADPTLDETAAKPESDLWQLEADGKDVADQTANPTSAEPAVANTPARRRDSAARTRLLSTIEELEAAVTDTDDFEPDGSETTPVVDWTKTRANEAVFGARAPSSSDEAQAAPDATPTPFANNAVAEPTGDLVEKLAASVVDTESEAFAARVDADLSEYLNADTVMDEAALREMVTDIVRQELQGALGERITRNVRKLVRREIYRALASEEFS